VHVVGMILAEHKQRGTGLCIRMARHGAVRGERGGTLRARGDRAVTEGAPFSPMRLWSGVDAA
jgi:hypothetical protein